MYGIVFTELGYYMYALLVEPLYIPCTCSCTRFCKLADTFTKCVHNKCSSARNYFLLKFYVPKQTERRNVPLPRALWERLIYSHSVWVCTSKTNIARLNLIEAENFRVIEIIWMHYQTRELVMKCKVIATANMLSLQPLQVVQSRSQMLKLPSLKTVELGRDGAPYTSRHSEPWNLRTTEETCCLQMLRNKCPRVLNSLRKKNS